MFLCVVRVRFPRPLVGFRHKVVGVGTQRAQKEKKVGRFSRKAERFRAKVVGFFAEGAEFRIFVPSRAEQSAPGAQNAPVFSSQHPLLFFFMTPTPDLDAQVRDIKRLLRAAMDGVLSHAMRQSGVNYRVNFGVETFRLVEMAADLPHSVRLSTALYADDIRELRLLAFLVVPPEEVDEELALHYVDGLRYVEEAQMLVLHLLAERPYASQLAFRLLAAEAPLARLVAWLLLGRLFMGGLMPTQRDADEILDHAATELADTAGEIGVRKAALNALYKYMELGSAEEARGERLLRQAGL